MADFFLSNLKSTLDNCITELDEIPSMFCRNLLFYLLRSSFLHWLTGASDSQSIRTDMTGQTEGKFITHDFHSRETFFPRVYSVYAPDAE